MFKLKLKRSRKKKERIGRDWIGIFVSVVSSVACFLIFFLFGELLNGEKKCRKKIGKEGKRH